MIPAFIALASAFLALACSVVCLRAALVARTLHPPCPKARVLFHPCGDVTCAQCGSHPAHKRKR